ncbi:MAG: type I methionyl aminopeptidase [Oligoflexia bacterium]|nr:type I methionyl aminopeptidase [Oligoflexia bacterium]
MVIQIKTAEEIILMRATCALATETLKYVSSYVKVGISTDEINTLAHDFMTKKGAIPAPLNYHGFPKSICTSRNSIICHGIPKSDEFLKEGDIVNLDITTKLNNYHGDTSATFFVGDKSKFDSRIIELVDVTYECMLAGIREVRPGARFGNIGAIIEEIAHDHNFSVVHEYCGHGIGKEFHEEPQVLHYGKRNSGPEMLPGMVFTIEPMINLGKRNCKLLSDGWTVVTADGKLSAQFEHTVMVTESGFEILT